MTVLRTLLAVAAASTAAACAHVDPPLLSLGDRACDSKPSMDPASPVTLGDSGGTAVKIGPTSPCLQTGGHRATYAAFRLPDTASPFLATVSSEIVGQALIAPRATVYDDAGKVTRTVKTAAFRTTVSGYQTGLRLGPHDRFVLLEADPAMLGDHVTLRLSARESGVQVAAAVPIIIIVPNGPPAQISEQSATIALNGRLRVAAAAIDRAP